MNETTSPIVGIDLGTTNSVVAVVIDGKPQVLTESGTAILPSVVGVDASGKLITGTSARNQQIAFPDRTIASVKRHMGSMEKLKLGDQTLSPPEVSAIILRKLRDRASAALGVTVSRAVITVPAFFDENQRQATREAGELAGFTVERIINEPTAATLVYHVGSDERQHLIVYDFGGGTFDVSIVRMEAGVIEVLSSRGDTHLGGDDLDSVLFGHVVDKFIAEHEIDLRKIPTARWRLLQACERAKCDLSSLEEVRIREEFIVEKNGSPLNLDIAVQRSTYERLIAAFVDRTIACVDEALRDSKLTLNQIDDLVLVGGSTRTPMVEDRLRREFAIQPSRSVDPDLAVALGAAVQGAMISGQSVGPVLVDITTHTLGIEVCSGFSFDGPQLEFSPIIHRGRPLPASYEQAYAAMHEDQERVEIHVLQGEHQAIDDNESIGKFVLKLSQNKNDDLKIVVRFDLSLDGTLKVTAKQIATGKSEELIIRNAMSTFREDRKETSAKLEAMFQTSDDGDAVDAIAWSREQADAEDVEGDGSRDSAASTLTKARRALATVEGDDANDIADLIERMETAIADRDDARIQELTAELDDVLFYVSG